MPRRCLSTIVSGTHLAEHSSALAAAVLVPHEVEELAAALALVHAVLARGAEQVYRAAAVLRVRVEVVLQVVLVVACRTPRNERRSE